MRILYVSSLYTPYAIGGAEQGLQALTESMASSGLEVHVATLAPRDSAGSGPESINGVQVHRVALRNVYWPWQQTRRHPSIAKSVWHVLDTSNNRMRRSITELANQIKPSIVVTGNLQGWSTGIVPALKASGIPVVHVINDYALLCPQTTLYRNGKACGTLNNRCKVCQLLTAPRKKHMEQVDAVIGVSQSVLSFHQAHGLFRSQPTAVIHNPLKPGFDIVPSTRGKLPGATVFGFLGRIEPLKGIENLLRATEQLDAVDPGFRLDIAGTPNSQRYLADIQARWAAPSIRYLGQVDAKAFLDSIDCLVVPSLWLEALGNVAFEAFARGVPVIGARTGGIPETVEHERTGLTYEQNDPIALATCMQRIIDSEPLRARLAQAALDKAPEYLADNRARSYGEFLSKIGAAAIKDH